MKKILLVFLMFDMSSIAFAGKPDSLKKERFFVLVNTAYGLPMGSFAFPISGINQQAMFSYHPQNSGFTIGNASAGPMYNIQTGIRITNKFGALVSANYGLNQFNNNFINNFYTVLVPNSYYGYGGTFTGPAVTDTWKSLFLLGGVYFSYPVKPIVIDFRMLSGAILCTSPNFGGLYTQHYQNEAGGTTYNYATTVASAKVTSWAMNAGISIRFKITNWLSWSINADALFTSAMTFNTTLQQETISSVYTPWPSGSPTYNNTPYYAPPSPFSYSTSVVTVNLGVGFRYTFVK